MTKKTNNTVSTSVETAVDTTKTNIAEKTPLMMSHAAEIFHGLTIEQKTLYFKDQYGTVKGMTGFFDYWFSYGIKDTKSFVKENGTIIDACIVRGGGYYEGGGGDDTNYIVVYIGDKAYSSPNVKYSEVTYYMGGGKKEEGNKALDYKELIDCTYNKATDICTVQIKNGYDKTISLELKEGSKCDFDEGMLGKLYIPSDIQAQDEKTSDITTAVKLDTASALEGEKKLTSKEMYSKVFTMYMDERKTNSAYELITEGKIEDTPETHDNLLKIFDENLIKIKPEDRYFSYSVSKPLTVFKCIKDIQEKKELGIILLENILAVGSKSYIDNFEEILEAIDVDKTSYKQRFFNSFYKDFDIRRAKDDLITQVEKLCGDMQENYQKLYEHYISEGGAYYLFLGGWDYKNAMDAYKKVQAFFTKHNIQDINLFPVSYNKKIGGYFSIDNMLRLVKESLITQEKATEIAKNSAQEFEEYIIKNKYFVEGAKMFEELNQKFGIPLGENYIRFIITKLTNSSDRNQYMKTVKGDAAFFKKFVEIAIAEENIYMLDSLYDLGQITERKHFILLATLCFQKGWMGDFKTIAEKEKFNEDELRLVTKSSTADEKVDKDSSYIPYATHEKVIQEVEKICQTKEVRDYMISELTKIFKRPDIDTTYVNSLLDKYFAEKNRDVLCMLLKSGGLKINKHKPNGFIAQCLEKKDFNTAGKIISSSGLGELWSKKIAVMKMQTGISSPYDISRAIEEYNLPKNYYSYGVDYHIGRRDLSNALKYCEEHKITMSDAQLAKYRELKAKDIEDAKKREEEHKEKERLEALKRVELAKGYAQLIEQGKYKTDVNYQRDQKYIFFLNANGLNIASHPLEYHADIAGKVGATKEQMMGGGWIKMDNEAKTVLLYGSSGSYGKVPEEYRKLLLDVMSKSYPEYTVSVSI